MSVKTKRVNKTQEELVKKIEDNQSEHFKKAIEEVEQKFGYKLEPAMYYTKMGAFPQIEIVPIKKKETKTEDVV
jgi:restriction endonuclease Mrr